MYRPWLGGWYRGEDCIGVSWSEIYDKELVRGASWRLETGGDCIKGEWGARLSAAAGRMLWKQTVEGCCRERVKGGFREMV